MKQNFASPKVRFIIPGGGAYTHLKQVIRNYNLHTICESSRCPNIGECSSRGSAAFLILGSACARNCMYCALAQGALAQGAPDYDEPAAIARAAYALNMKYIVITSPSRDDLADGGAGCFAKTVTELRSAAPDCAAELLVPDFARRMERALDEITSARPAVLNHNIEAAQSVFARVRPMGNYKLSLALLSRAARLGNTVKSGLMVGLGESIDDVAATLAALRETGCSIVTVGQYLQPGRGGLPVQKYYTAAEFCEIRETAQSLGFTAAAGPNVRSSYHAMDMAPPECRTAEREAPLFPQQ
jgi:lipoic acid synthetase